MKMKPQEKTIIDISCALYKKISTDYYREDPAVQTLGKKLNPFLKKIYDIDNPDSKFAFNVQKLNDDAYKCLEKGLINIAKGYGVDKWMSLIPSEKTIVKDEPDSKHLYPEKKEALQAIMKLRVLLFEVSVKNNSKAQDKTYYDRLWRIRCRYLTIYNRIEDRKRAEKRKASYLEILRELEIMINSRKITSKKLASLSRRLKKLEDEREARLKQLEKQSMTFHKKLKKEGGRTGLRDMADIQMINKQNGLGFELPFKEDFFSAYLKLSLKSGKKEFAYELDPGEDELYEICCDVYKIHPDYDIKKLIRVACRIQDERYGNSDLILE